MKEKIETKGDFLTLCSLEKDDVMILLNGRITLIRRTSHIFSIVKKLCDVDLKIKALLGNSRFIWII